MDNLKCKGSEKDPFRVFVLFREQETISTIHIATWRQGVLMHGQASR